MRDILKEILDTAKKTGVQYADIRFRNTSEELIQTNNDILKHYHRGDDVGVGIRVLKNGRWGFSATHNLKKDSLEKALKNAISISDSTQNIGEKGIERTKEIPIIKKYKSKIEKDPFKVPFENKIEILKNIHEKTSKNPLIKKTDGQLYFKKMHQILLTSEGSDLENDFYISSGQYEAKAVNENGFQGRRFQEDPQQKGFEYIENLPLVADAERIAEEAVMKLKAKSGPCGKRDLILLPSNLFLTIHESVGHPTELDRVLGWEANFAGTSFATTEKLGKFKYGSNLVNFVADNTLEYGLSTWGWDDDGITGKKWDIVKDGILVGYGTTREVAHYIGQNKSTGCNFADSWKSQPINRIPNLYMLPGKENLTLDELIADTKDGLIIDGRDSFSIDQRRYNFQFGGDFVREIKNGKIGDVVKDVTYQSITPEFWNSCDAVCDERFFKPCGTLFCGKGEPVQLHHMTHGSAPARFRNISIGGAFNG